MDFSNGSHIYLEITPNAGDSWVDHHGTTITQLGIAQKDKGSANPLCAYDFDLQCGEVSSSFENWPLSPLAKVSDFQFSITSVWSDPQGIVSTSNVLWLLEEANAQTGKTFNIIGRKAKVWVSNSAMPGLTWVSGTTWQNYTQTTSYTLSTPAPSAVESATLLYTGVVEEIKLGGSSGRIDIQCEDVLTDKVLGRVLTNPGDNGKKVVPLTYGNFTSANLPMPVSIEKSLDKITVAWLGDAPHYEYDGLCVYDEQNNKFWNVVNTNQSVNNNTAVNFTTTGETNTAVARTDTNDDWNFQAAEFSALKPADCSQVIYTVEGENVAIHSDKLTAFSIGSTSYAPMVSRGWGDSLRATHASGLPYHIADEALQSNLLTLDMDLLPTKIYDASETYKSDVSTEAPGYDQTALRYVGGNPWAVIKNSVSGGTIADPIAFSIPPHSDTDNGKHFQEVNFVFEFPDVSAYSGAVIDDANLYLDAHWAAWLSNPTVNGMYIIFNDDETTKQTLFPLGCISYDNTYAYPISAPHGAGISLETLSKVRIFARLDWVSIEEIQSQTHPYLLINAIKIKARVTIPIKTTLKLYAYGWGRVINYQGTPYSLNQFNHGNRIIEDLYNSNFSAGVLGGSGCALSADFSITEQANLRDVVRNVAQVTANVVHTDASGVPVISKFLDRSSFGAVCSINDDCVLLADRNLPDLTCSIPTKSAVYSRFELRYGWDYARERYLHEIVVDGSATTLPNLYTYDGVHQNWKHTDATTFSLLLGIATDAQDYIGQSSPNTFVLETKYLQDGATAEVLMANLIKWLATPRMAAQVALDYAQTQDVQLLNRLSLNVTGFSRLASKSWLVVGCAVDPGSMVKTVTLTEIPSTF